MADQDVERKGSGFGWILWWRIDPAELEDQVARYGELSIWKSMRGVSALLFVFSMIVTASLAYFHFLGIDAYAYFDVALSGVFAIFIYLGHRWAMIAADLLDFGKISVCRRRARAWRQSRCPDQSARLVDDLHARLLFRLSDRTKAPRNWRSAEIKRRDRRSRVRLKPSRSSFSDMRRVRVFPG